MMRWSDKTLVAVGHLAAAVAESQHDTQARAQAALECLSGLIAYDCALLCRTDGRSLSAVAVVGHNEAGRFAVAREEYRGEQKALEMDRTGLPLRFRDLPCRGRSTFTATELAWPAGLRDGMGMSLRFRSGHVVGHVALNAVRDGSFTDEHRDLLALLGRPLAAAVAAPAPAVSPAFGLTRREVEVLGLIIDGRSNAQIADALMISRSTVRRHVEHILRKLGVSSRTAAAVKASRTALLTRLPPQESVT
jgi:DNA-binding CsgD family transcriptional regulator